jgi:HK97 family phage portal protein
LLNWLRSKFVEKKALDINSAWALIDLGRATASGFHVSPETALRCPAVRGAVAVLAESISQLPLVLYERGADGSKERAVDHPLYEILHDQPNDWTSSVELRRDLQADLILHGNGYAFINRSRASGQVVELVRIPPTAVQVEVDELSQEPIYHVTDRAGVRRPVDRADLLHLRALSSDGYLGRSPLMDCKEAIALSLAMEAHQAKLFANGARPAGLLRIKGRLNPQTLERLQQDFSEKWNGLAGSGKTMILEEDSSFEPVTFTSVEIQHLELRKHQVAEIARALRIPLHLLGDWERATWSNAETAGLQFVSFTLMPWLKLWEGAIRRALLSPEERRRFFVEFLVDDLVRADIAARFEAYGKAATNGLFTINEIRGLENRPPLPGGDDLRVPMNTEPASAEEPVA